MSRTLEITVRLKDENGESVIQKTSEKEIPYLEEFPQCMRLWTAKQTRVG